LGLYLCVFDGDREVEGVDLGSYADFASLRSHVLSTLENSKRGSRFPTLMLHADSDGEWAPGECERLAQELKAIRDELRGQPPVPFSSEWQRDTAKQFRVVPQSALECFIDVDGELAVERILGLAELSIALRQPILFQ